MTAWSAPDAETWWGRRHGVLRPAEVRRSLRQHPEWRLEGERLVRELRFADFHQAFACVKQVAAEVEDFGRHPDICLLDGNRVRFAVANPNRAGITLAEMRLVQKVDAAVLGHVDRVVGGPRPGATGTYAGAHEAALTA